MPEENATVPAALQKQMDALTSQAPEEGTPTPETPAPTEAAPPPEPETAPTPAPTQESTEQGTPQPAPVAEPNDETWEHKYRVVSGRIAADSRTHRRAMQEKDAELATLREQLEAQKAQPQAPQAPPPQPQAKAFDLDATMATITDDEVEKMISEQDIEDYGMAYWKQILGVQRLGQPQPQADVQTAPVPTGVPAEVTQRLDYLEGLQRQQSDHAFFADLTTLAPNWESTEVEEGFVQWREQVEPMSGKTYGELIEDAYYDHDPMRTAALFEQYAASKPSAPPPPPGHTVESQVVPPSGGAPSPSTPQGDTMTLDQWNLAMKELTKGNMTPERVAERHKELVAMARAGRVTEPTQPMQGIW